jgi:hypothetical protein
VADAGDARVTNAVLDERLKHLTDLFEDYCKRSLGEQREIKDQLKTLNGTVRLNKETLIVADSRIGHLEDWKAVVEAWRTSLLATAFKWAVLGLSLGAGVGAVFYGIGHALGKW